MTDPSLPASSVARAARTPIAMIADFLRYETLGGLLLIAAAAAAMLVANAGLDGLYGEFKSVVVELRAGNLSLAKPLILWVNEGLMAIFFFLAGLEIKRELLRGELASRKQATLPFLAAIAGMGVPALVYLGVTAGDAEAMKGWAIPAATDIAFALGIMSLLRGRVPDTLKVLLTAIAVLDDVGAIVVIAVFYSGELAWLSLAIAGVAAAGLFALNRAGVVRVAPYVLLGLVMWVAVLKSGVHATLAGVVTALAIPHHGRDAEGRTPLEHLEHTLHPWVAFGVLPLFGFLNAGVALAGVGFAALVHPVTLGIALGLFAGKQIGVFAAIFLAVKLRLARMPAGLGWGHIYGLAVLTGVGFTMSLFIGELAFSGLAREAETRLGVLLASFASAVWGYGVLRLARAPAGPAD